VGVGLASHVGTRVVEALADALDVDALVERQGRLDDANWDDEIAENLNDLPDHLPELEVVPSLVGVEVAVPRLTPACW
jgi:hypothetical protein